MDAVTPSAADLVAAVTDIDLGIPAPTSTGAAARDAVRELAYAARVADARLGLAIAAIRSQDRPELYLADLVEDTGLSTRTVRRRVEEYAELVPCLVAAVQVPIADLIAQAVTGVPGAELVERMSVTRAAIVSVIGPEAADTATHVTRADAAQILSLI